MEVQEFGVMRQRDGPAGSPSTGKTVLDEENYRGEVGADSLTKPLIDPQQDQDVDVEAPAERRTTPSSGHTPPKKQRDQSAHRGAAFAETP